MHLGVSDIDTPHVLTALEPIWTKTPETASRVRGRIEKVLDWAKARGYRSGENPARWKGNLAHLLPKQTIGVKHHAALPYVEIPTLMAKLSARKDTSAKALEFTIFTAARTNEVIGARWSEFDLEQATWTLAPERMKAGREHRVPLSRRAVDLLRSIRPMEGCDFVFVSRLGRRAISNNTMLRALKRLEPKATVHGVARSSFRDWAAEQTAYPAEVCELALAHTVGSKVERAYLRGDIFGKRRRLMEDWATFCASTLKIGGVVPLRAHG